ncbi:MAG: translation initiation factor IF-2 [Elusimicrobiota bacterium]
MGNKKRIYELSREWNVENKEIIKDAKELGIDVKTHSSSVNEEEAELIKESLKEQGRISAEKEVEEDKKQKEEQQLKQEKQAEVQEKEEIIEEKAEKKAEKKKKVAIDPTMSIQELAERIEMDVDELINVFDKNDIVVTENQKLNIDRTKEILQEIGYEVEISKIFSEIIDTKRKDFRTRAPIVTVMGHVDHGKTQLLDTIRHTNVIAGERGGITQHIGAYRVDINKKGTIVFIDTPGHEAFTAMRARGAQITDIVVLVVAADDGVMPQTVEAINHSRAANVPIIVAINKMDLPDADSEKVKTQLSQHNLISEDWGGDTIMVEISAKENQNIDDLLEMILLQSEMMEIKAPYDGPATGIVIESELDKRIGPTGTVLVTEGVLKTGDSFICGTVPGKIKAMTNEIGKRLKTAGPSVPIKILGFEDLPDNGAVLEVVEKKTKARDIAEQRKIEIEKTAKVEEPKKMTLEDLQRQLLGEEKKELRIILKTDAVGSLEAIKDALSKMSTEEVNLNILHGDVGAISKRDIMLASASDAIIIGFNMSVSGSVKKEADREGVQIRTYRVIYEIIDDIKKALEGMLEPEEKEVSLGRAEVKEVFNISGVGTIAGCSVENGLIRRGSTAKILRDSRIVYQGKINSLKRFKKDVSEVSSGYECGIKIENFNDIKIGDIIESFEVQKRKRTLEETK